MVDLVEIVGLVNLLTNLIVTFVPLAKQWRAIQKVNLSDQSDIPANSEVSEVVINCVVWKDNL